MSRPAPYFSPAHPLADAAARNCEKHTGQRGFGVGRVACGACWELAIRDDERLVVQCELPREIEPDPEYVDEIAVELACRGERVELTPADLRAAVARLARRGWSEWRIAAVLHVNQAVVRQVLHRQASTTESAAAAAA